MLKLDKIELVNNFKTTLGKFEIVVLLGHQNIKFDTFDKARREAPEGTIVLKVKNKLAKIALVEKSYNSIKENLKNQNFFVLSNDLFNACKIAKFFTSTDGDNVKIIVGADKNKSYESGTIIELGSINSIQELQSHLLRGIKVVAENLLRVISKKIEKERQ